MGELKVERLTGGIKRTKYISQLLNDIRALEHMLDHNMFDNQTIRIGAEQEFCLVEPNWEPSNRAMDVLKKLKDPHFTTELALYNLEANLDPLVLTADCFSKMHTQLNDLLAMARKEAATEDLKVILTGILPTIGTRHLKNSYMTPMQRYKVLDSTIRDFRGEDLELHIRGVDEINLRHDSILFEGCNTSFQSHLQVDTDDFANSYNWAQAIAGPILSVCANSPLLMGRELWQETRIALFTQSVDTRPSTFFLHEREARVGFGKDWVTGSVVDYFKESIIQFRSMLTGNFDTDSFKELSSGTVPKLRALNLHNGTVYKWNRVCYGVTEGKPHVRIENRYIPSGPTSTDEIANLMFWVGVMRGRPKEFDDIHNKVDFKDVKSNFYNAARYGSAAQFYWKDELIPAKELLLDHLLPMAYRGLYGMKVSPNDVERYLSIIEKRIKGTNGSRWVVQSFRALKKKNKTPDALRMLMAAMYDRERKGYTIDAWQLARGNELAPDAHEKTVRHCMSRKMITAQQGDSAELVLKMMNWKNIHHVPIMNAKYNLVGLLTWSDMEEHLLNLENIANKSIKDIMKTELITTAPNTLIGEAKKVMASHKINCLPVVRGKKLMGILTSNDI